MKLFKKVSALIVLNIFEFGQNCSQVGKGFKVLNYFKIENFIYFEQKKVKKLKVNFKNSK